MDKIRLGLVGCGGMGTRHLYGLRELVQSPFSNVELCAVCDIRRENAELAAQEAEKLMGIRPQIFTDLAEMARIVPDLTAVDVVTDPSVHHDVVCQALDLGLHVMVEKPMAITVKACRQMLEAAERNNRHLSVAENFRRDPSARLVHYLLQSGAIGTPYMGLFHSLGPGNGIFITPWRHLKERGGALLDMAVHFTHMIRYQLGDIAEVYGDVRLVELPATAEDTSLAMFRMENGATVNWLVGLSGHGGCGGEVIFGNEGSINGFGTRGGSISMQRRGQEARNQEEILASIDGFSLELLAEYLFPTGISAGDSAVDWKLIALEYYELAEAILNGRKIEVDGGCGLKDVAALYAIFESSRAGRALRMSEVENCEVYAYQAEIDEALSLQ